jgi:hypothetical protein
MFANRMGGTNRITVEKANMEGGRPYFTLRVYTGVQIRGGIYGRYGVSRTFKVTCEKVRKIESMNGRRSD